MEEHWINIDNSIYQVSNNGNVRNGATNKILKPRLCGDYYNVFIIKNGFRKQIYVHRLVAEAFLPNPSNYPIINHKDENKLNNFVWVNPDGSVDPEKSNLEWCTYKYNINYGKRTSKAIETRIKHKKNGIPILQIDKSGTIINAFMSCAEAQRETNICKTCIRAVLKGKRHTAGGYKWIKQNT